VLRRAVWRRVDRVGCRMSIRGPKRWLRGETRVHAFFGVYLIASRLQPGSRRSAPARGHRRKLIEAL